MKKIKVLFLTAIMFLSLSIPAFAETQTQLETREFQTRTYETKDTKLVMKAVLNVLQDEGFIVTNANTDLGFISANKEYDINDKNIDVQKEFGISRFKAKMKGCMTSNTEITVNMTNFGDKTKIRANFKRKLLSIYDSALKIDDIKDEKYYQDFFAKVDKGIFIQKEKI